MMHIVGKIERFWFVVVALAALWYAVPSTIFVNPVATIVDPERGTVTFKRDTPFGDVIGRWHAEITLLRQEPFECQSGDWRPIQYQEQNGNTVVYPLTDWAMPCIEAGPPYLFRVTRQVLLFGVIPLRADTDTTLVEIPDQPRGQTRL